MEALGDWYTNTRGPLTDNDSRAKPFSGSEKHRTLNGNAQNQSHVGVLTPGNGNSRMPNTNARNQGPWRQGKFLTPQRNQSHAKIAQNQPYENPFKPRKQQSSGLSVAFQAQTLAPVGRERCDNIAVPKSLWPNATSQASLWNPERPTIVFNKRTIQLRKGEFERGMIINAPVFHEDSNPSESVGTINASLSAFAHVYGKPRYLIVTGLFTTTYQVVPVFSHNGTGLKGKENYEHEFVSINDGRNRGNFEALSDYEPLVTTGKGGILRRDSVVHFVNPISRRYELKVELHGSLLPASTDRLAHYIAEAAKKGMGI